MKHMTSRCVIYTTLGQNAKMIRLKYFTNTHRNEYVGGFLKKLCTALPSKAQ